ncbi:MAG: PIN domain-containing protein [Alkalispirochaeta sp.]
MTAYLDSSVALRYILVGEVTIHHVLDYPRVISSELLEIECRRVIHRVRMQRELTDDGVVEAFRRLDGLLSGIDLLELSREVKIRAAESFPVVVGTLDALHITTALLWARDSAGEAGTTGDVHIFSHDAALNACARTVGLTARLE